MARSNTKILLSTMLFNGSLFGLGLSANIGQSSSNNNVTLHYCSSNHHYQHHHCTHQIYCILSFYSNASHTCISRQWILHQHHSNNIHNSNHNFYPNFYPFYRISYILQPQFITIIKLIHFAWLDCHKKMTL